MAQDFVQVRGMVGEDVNAFVEVAVTGGLGNTSVAGQAVYATALGEPAQRQHRLPTRAERPGALRGAAPAPVGGQRAGEEFDDEARDIERGNIGNQREAGIDKPDLYDPKINKAYAELATHYGALVDPTPMSCPGMNRETGQPPWPGACRSITLRFSWAVGS